MEILKGILHPKILALKRQAGPISFDNTVANPDIDLLDLRIVQGYGCIWNTRSLSGYKFPKGCCAKSIKEHGPGTNSHYQIKFLNQHSPDDPLSLHEILKEDDQGLFFKTVPLDEVDSATRLIKQLRSKTINNFSHGFDPVWNKAEYDDSDDSIVFMEIQLFEISAVTIPAGLSTYRVQGIQGLEDLDSDIDYYISTLPRKFQLQARNLFATQKSLINLEPFEENKKTLQKNKPAMKQAKKINYNYLTKNI